MNDDMMFFGSRSTNLFATADNNEQMLLPGSIDPEVGLLLPAIQKATGGDPSPTTRSPELASVDEILLGGNSSALAGVEPDEIDVAFDADADILIGAIQLPAIDDIKAIFPPPNDQTWSQDTPGIQYDPEAFDFFGQAVTTGDFNGDGFADLVVGAPGESVGASNPIEDAGAVNVIYGSASGLVPNGPPLNDQVWTQNSAGLNAGFGAETGDAFGASVTAGDFNGDGYTDLAVGAPNEDVNSTTNAGAVNIIYGSANGLTATDSEFWTQDSPGIDAGFDAEAGDNFGKALTAGDFNGDGYVDLAVGAPGEDVFDIANAGAVNVLYGSANGLTATGDQIWHQNSGQAQASPVLSSVAEAGDNFGASLTSGDFDGDGIDDLAVGSPGESVGNIGSAGAATVIYGSANRLTATGHQTWHQDSAGILDEAEAGDRFSASLTSGDFNDDGIDDLAVGVYSEDIGDIAHAGAVNVIYGSSNRLTATGDQFWSQNSAGIQGHSEYGDYFGWSLTSGDFDGDGIDDLGVGVPLEESDSNSTNAGAVNILRGSVDRLTGLNDRFLSQNTLDLADNPSEAHDRFGWSLTAGDFNGDGHSDLVVGVPNEDIGNITDAGEVNVFYDV